MKLKGKWFRYKYVPVYENSLGDKIHISDDMVRIGGLVQRVRYCDNNPLFYWCLSIMGNNCRRALMLYVEKVRKM